MAPAPEFFEWTHFCSILFFSVELADEDNFLYRADPVLLIRREMVENPECRAGGSDPIHRGGPTFPHSVGHVRNALAVLSVLTCRSNEVFEVGEYGEGSRRRFDSLAQHRDPVGVKIAEETPSV